MTYKELFDQKIAKVGNPVITLIDEDTKDWWTMDMSDKTMWFDRTLINIIVNGMGINFAGESRKTNSRNFSGIRWIVDTDNDKLIAEIQSYNRWGN